MSKKNSETPDKLRAMASRMHPESGVNGVNVKQLLTQAAKEIETLQACVTALEETVNKGVKPE